MERERERMGGKRGNLMIWFEFECLFVQVQRGSVG